MQAIIDPTAEIGPGCQLGYGVIIEAGARIGANCTLGHHVVVHAGTQIADGVRIGVGAVLGRRPTPARSSTVRQQADLPALQIDAEAIIGAAALIYAGSSIGAQTLVADQAFIRERVRLGASCIAGRGVAIENDTQIGARVKMQTGAYITAYVQIEDDVFIAPCVVTTNDNTMNRGPRTPGLVRGCHIRRAARIGANSTILPHIEIGADAFVAAGSLVTRDVPPAVLVMGVPARIRRAVPHEELLQAEA